MPARIEVADIFRTFGPAYRQQYGATLSTEQRQAMTAIETCRTAALGGHVDQCDACGAIRISYNSCRNRHCPKCQALDQERWLEARQHDLLPIPYFHVVFTLPQVLRPLALCNQRIVYHLLFKAASQSLMQLARDPQHLGAHIGCIALLHTWSQTLAYHPHLHCIVTGGGLSDQGTHWVAARNDFFLPVQVLAALFRGKFLSYLKAAYQTGQLTFPSGLAAWARHRGFNRQLTTLYQTDWVVYCKPPFATPEQTLAYVARYTHRVAISNERLLAVENDQVRFHYRDRHDGNRRKVMTLPADVFIRRFLRHVLPHQLRKIRHYGLLSNRTHQANLARCQQLLAVPQTLHPKKKLRTWQERLKQYTGIDPHRCPHCKKGRMITQQVLLPQAIRPPPGLQRRSA